MNELIERLGLRVFADLCGVSDDFIYKVQRGERKFGPMRCLNIEAQTQGLIGAALLRPDIFSRSYTPPPVAGDGIIHPVYINHNPQNEKPPESDHGGVSQPLD